VGGSGGDVDGGDNEDVEDEDDEGSVGGCCDRLRRRPMSTA
jgi:hypothetical protein